MRWLIALLAVLLPTVAFADLCGSNTERVYTLAASTPQTVGVGLTGRKQITVCSSIGNTVTSVVQCRGDGSTVTLGDSYVGYQLARGQCRVFGTPGTVPVSCVSNESSVIVKTEECTGSPPAAVINAPPASSTVAGAVTANQGTAGSSSWPVKVADATTPAQTLAVDAAGKIGVSSMPAITGTVTAIASTAAKGATTAGSPTSTSASADRQPADVLLRNSSGVELGNNTTPVVVSGAVTSATKGTSTGAGVTSTAASADRQPLDVTLRRSDGTATGDVTTPLVVAGAVTTSGTATVVGTVQSYHGSTAGLLYNSGVVANGAEILSGCLDTSKIDLLGIVVTNSDTGADRFVTVRFYDTTTCTNPELWSAYATATKAMRLAFSFGLGSTGPSAWDTSTSATTDSAAPAVIKLPPGVKIGLTAQGSSNGQIWVW